MRIIIQRVQKAQVEVNQKIVGKIGAGYLLLVGIHDSDTPAVLERMAQKVAQLRIFDDEMGRMNLSLLDVQGSVLSISQFTLFADAKKGNRPSFSEAGEPNFSKEMYQLFNQQLRKLNINVEEGIFAADMKVSLLNDGPVTIYLDSKEMSWGK